MRLQLNVDLNLASEKDQRRWREMELQEDLQRQQTFAGWWEWGARLASDILKRLEGPPPAPAPLQYGFATRGYEEPIGRSEPPLRNWGRRSPADSDKELSFEDLMRDDQMDSRQRKTALDEALAKLDRVTRKARRAKRDARRSSLNEE